MEQLIRKVEGVKSVKDNLILNLKRLRNARGLTQAKMAERVDLSVRGYQKYEQGESWPDAEMMEKLSSALGVSVLGLLGGVDHLKDRSKVFPDVGAGRELLAKFESLKPQRKALVAMLIYDDESYLFDQPELARAASALLKD